MTRTTGPDRSGRCVLSRADAPNLSARNPAENRHCATLRRAIWLGIRSQPRFDACPLFCPFSWTAIPRGQISPPTNSLLDGSERVSAVRNGKAGAPCQGDGYNKEKPDYPPTDSSEWTSGPGNRDQFCDVGCLDGART